jgi:hypothetical protein
MPEPPSGRTLLTGPSNVGKTRATAALLDAWVDAKGPSGVVVLDFAPEVWRGGRLLGGRIDRFTDVPDAAWHGVIDAHAPRAEADGDEAALVLARENAGRAEALLDSAPPPRAVFVNDATIPYQSPDADASSLVAYCDDAVAACNAFESDELGTEDPVSRAERDALATLREWADTVRRLDPGDSNLFTEG